MKKKYTISNFKNIYENRIAKIKTVLGLRGNIKFRNVIQNVIKALICSLSEPLTLHKFVEVSGHHLAGSVHLFEFLLAPVPHRLNVFCRVGRCVNELNLVVKHDRTAESRLTVGFRR